MRAFCLLLTLLATMAVGCGYEDPRPDPRSQSDFVDTSDPSVLLQKNAEERKARAKGR